MVTLAKGVVQAVAVVRLFEEKVEAVHWYLVEEKVVASVPVHQYHEVVQTQVHRMILMQGRVATLLTTCVSFILGVSFVLHSTFFQKCSV